MPLTQQVLLALLDSAGVSYVRYEHPPIFTANDGIQYCSQIPGTHAKNLFLRDQKKSQYILITVKDEKRVDLLALAKLIDIGRLSFASDCDLISMLCVQPGSVTPFAILNDQEKLVKFFMDKILLQSEYINVHPMENTATLHLKIQDLLAFIESRYDRKINLIDVL